ncbi:MAG: hypothetical protein ACFB9M_03525 [Myxococcota bacterium]
MEANSPSGPNESDFELIAEPGFGDRELTYPWAAETFDADDDGMPEVYIGTWADALCKQVVLGLDDVSLPGFPPARWQCADSYLNSAFKTRVYRGTWNGGASGWSFEPVWEFSTQTDGVRNAIVYDDELFVLIGITPFPAINAPLWKSSDGRTFEPAFPPELAIAKQVTGLRSSAIFKGNLVVTTPSSFRVFMLDKDRIDDPETVQGWSQVNSDGFADSGGPGEALSVGGASAIGVFAGHLYISAITESGPQIFKTDDPRPGNWTLISDQGYFNPERFGYIQAVPFKDHIYFTSGIYPPDIENLRQVVQGAEVIRIDADDNVEVLVGNRRPAGTPGTNAGFSKSGLFDGFNRPTIDYAGWSAWVYNCELYVGTFDTSALIFDVLTSLDYGAILTEMASGRLAALGFTPEVLENLMQQTDGQFLERVRSVGGGKYFDAIFGPRGFDLYRTRDGIRWSAVTMDGMNSPDTYGVRNYAITPRGLIVAGTDPIEGLKLWRAKARQKAELKSGRLNDLGQEDNDSFHLRLALDDAYCLKCILDDLENRQVRIRVEDYRAVIRGRDFKRRTRNGRPVFIFDGHPLRSDDRLRIVIDPDRKRLTLTGRRVDFHPENPIRTTVSLGRDFTIRAKGELDVFGDRFFRTADSRDQRTFRYKGGGDFIFDFDTNGFDGTEGERSFDQLRIRLPGFEDDLSTGSDLVRYATSIERDGDGNTDAFVVDGRHLILDFGDGFDFLVLVDVIEPPSSRSRSPDLRLDDFITNPEIPGSVDFLEMGASDGDHPEFTVPPIPFPH